MTAKKTGGRRRPPGMKYSTDGRDREIGNDENGDGHTDRRVAARRAVPAVAVAAAATASFGSRNLRGKC